MWKAFIGNQFRKNYKVHAQKPSEITPKKKNPICEICGKIFTSLVFPSVLKNTKEYAFKEEQRRRER